MRWGRFFAFTGEIRRNHRLQLFFEDRDLQLQLIDQIMLIDYALVEDIERVFDVCQPDFEFGNSVLHVSGR